MSAVLTVNGLPLEAILAMLRDDNQAEMPPATIPLDYIVDLLYTDYGKEVPMTQTMTHEEILGRLRQQARVYGSQNNAARELGVSVQYLAEVLQGRRPIGPTLLQALGIRKVITYEEISE